MLVIEYPVDEPPQRLTIAAPAWLAEAIQRLAGKERRSVSQELLRAREAHGKHLEEKTEAMQILEYKLDGKPEQHAAIDEAIRVTQFVRNKCLRLWMDAAREDQIDGDASNRHCAVLAHDFAFARKLHSQARQAAAERAWAAIQSFYANCQTHTPGKKGYPQFQHDYRSVEHKVTGWKLDPDGKHITFTDELGIAWEVTATTLSPAMVLRARRDAEPRIR
jgi:hypothetical protein